ncbi:MAG: anthranilate phosphoribosyltransferase [Gemmatimonadales bacterium]
MPVAELLETLATRSLDPRESYTTFAELVDGRLTELEIAALLAALKTRGETPGEIAGAARALRDAAVPFPKPLYPVADSCGTGGDGAGTVNLSTAAAFVAAAAGVRVAKHGNRASSSRCGSADLLEASGVRLDPPPEVARRCLDQAGICFLFAPVYHPGVRRVTSVRRALRTRTVFNLLGPLANPAKPEIQVMGIYARHLVRPAALTLAELGCESALVVHGAGLDELALHGPTTAALLRDGVVTDLEITPEAAGLDRAPIAALAASGGAAEAAAWLRTLLGGDGDPVHRAAVALNAGAMLWIAGLADSLTNGTTYAAELLDGGAGLARLDALREVSHGA